LAKSEVAFYTEAKIKFVFRLRRFLSLFCLCLLSLSFLSIFHFVYLFYSFLTDILLFYLHFDLFVVSVTFPLSTSLCFFYLWLLKGWSCVSLSLFLLLVLGSLKRK
jgi:hypothetical protein